jgi:hypothetical protein
MLIASGRTAGVVAALLVAALGAFASSYLPVGDEPAAPCHAPAPAPRAAEALLARR